MLKKVILILTLCLLLGLTGCKDESLYRIVKEDGQYYMVFTQEDYGEGENPGWAPLYTSVFEMKRELLAGNLSEKYVRTIWEGTGGERCPLWNMDVLYDIQTPEPMDQKVVAFHTNTYLFNFWNDKVTNADVRMQLTEEDYQAVYERFHKITKKMTVTSVEKISDRNATVTYYYTGAGDFKWVDYEIVLGDVEIKVQEDYCLSYKWGDGDAVFSSEAAPKNVYLYITQGDQRYVISMNYNSREYERPTVEWLSGFRLLEINDPTPIIDLLPNWVMPTIICVSVALLAGAGFLVISVQRKKKAAVQATPETISDNTELKEDT